MPKTTKTQEGDSTMIKCDFCPKHAMFTVTSCGCEFDTVTLCSHCAGDENRRYWDHCSLTIQFA